MTPPTRFRPLPGAWGAGALVLAFAALGWAVSGPGLVHSLDVAVRQEVLASQIPLVRGGLAAVTHLGNAVLVTPVFLLVCGLLSRLAASAEPLVGALIAAGLLAVTVVAFKAGVGRPSPNGDPAAPLSGAWPSGHTATAVVLYGFLACTLLRYLPAAPNGARRATQALFGLPAVVAVGLVYCDYHWLSDVVGGFLLGVLIVAAAQDLARRLLRSRRLEPAAARPTAAQKRA